MTLSLTPLRKQRAFSEIFFENKRGDFYIAITNSYYREVSSHGFFVNIAIWRSALDPSHSMQPDKFHG